MSTSLIATLTEDIAAAMRSQDRIALPPLRMLKTALVNRRVEKGSALTDAEAMAVVASLVKQRRDSVEQFTAGGRSDLAAVETSEIAILERYLPPPVELDEIERAVDAAIAELGATSPRALGAVMKQVMTAMAGRLVDGKAVSQLVRNKLGG